nr:MAG TPA: hypothetical protein [Caudoviricetes sp.]
MRPSPCGSTCDGGFRCRPRCSASPTRTPI